LQEEGADQVQLTIDKGEQNMGAKALTKILVVEDEIITAKALEKSLKDLGYDVVGIASSGEEAINKTADLRPDVVLMDIKLKGSLDGVSTAQRIHTVFNTPVIYLTAHSDTETVKRVMHSRPYGYIVKPFKEKELNAAIVRALHQHKIKK
jgi:DNA-binding NarL/FixJ family response regulator